MKIVTCMVCKNDGPSIMKGSVWVSVLLLATISLPLFLLPTIAYSVWRRSGNGLCRFCDSTTVVLVKAAAPRRVR